MATGSARFTISWSTSSAGGSSTRFSKSGSGFLGLDDRYYPIDWDQLTFDTRLGGYRVNIVEEDLQRSGSWDRNERWSERGPMRGERGRFERDRDRYSERGRMRDRDEDRGLMREPW